MLAICLFWLWPVLAAAQSVPLLNMGYSGAGIGSDLLKVIERAGLWRRHGIDVRTIYLSSGSLMAQTMSSGDIGVAGFDTPGVLKQAVAGANIKVVGVPINRIEPMLVGRSKIKVARDF
jgi:ABC-type nitrate/sulfonate/bicarbonate transport system substrate-binding protein